MDGRGVAVTGGGGWLGSAMALALAEAGAAVVVIGRTLEPLEAVAARASGLPGSVLPLKADAFEEATLGAVVELLAAQGRRLRGWVNNAYSGSMTQLEQLEEEGSVADTLRSGLGDPMVTSVRVAREVTDNGGGSIVNVSSMYGIVSPRPGVYRDDPEMHNPPVYGAAKAGLIQFTRYAAVHWAKRGVRVNALVPGAFPPPTVRPGFIARLEEQIPMGRVGRPEDLSGAAVFLLSDASSYITGQVLVVDGGWTAW
jgi:NAD(P)-dependent dehydrogenase (short-subunit alcohol dehydrogenase family)